MSEAFSVGQLAWSRYTSLAILMALAASGAGCRYDNASSKQEPLEIIGTYDDDTFCTSHHVITQDSWTVTDSAACGSGTSLYHIAAYDNLGQFVVAQNDDVLSFNPGKFSRLDWTHFNGDLFMCQQQYAADTFDIAYADQNADRTNPVAGGCGLPANDFPWTNLTPPLGP